jgi:hypothetical protein
MPADAQKKMQEWANRMQAATPEQRRAMINELPEAFRERARQAAREKGWKIAD